MIFYLSTLGIIVLVTLVLAWSILHLWGRLVRNEAKRAWNYFLPTILGVLLFVHAYYFLIPWALDAPSIIAGRTEVKQLSFTRKAPLFGLEGSDKNVYVVSPMDREEVDFGTPYLTRFGKHSRIVVKYEPLETQ